MKELGKKIKSIRKERRLSIVNLSSRADCSPAYLSMVENGKINPSLTRVKAITDGLGISIDDLFREKIHTSVVLRRKDRIRNEVPELNLAGEILTPDIPGKKLDARLLIIHPDGSSNGSYDHKGEEFGYVLKGSFELTVENESYWLNEGDSFFFESKEKHGFRNPTNHDAIIIWVNQNLEH